jgi:hypothetical protein
MQKNANVFFQRNDETCARIFRGVSPTWPGGFTDSSLTNSSGRQFDSPLDLKPGIYLIDNAALNANIRGIVKQKRGLARIACA